MSQIGSVRCGRYKYTTSAHMTIAKSATITITGYDVSNKAIYVTTITKRAVISTV